MIYNTGFGIKVAPAQVNCIIVKNSLVGVAGNALSVPAGNDAGPTGNASSATSPWANIVN